MKTVTVRNIPENVINTIRVLSKSERRSINNEFLVLIETGINTVLSSLSDNKMISHLESADSEKQLRAWEEIAGKWEDSRDTSEIIRDIVDSRSEGREVSL